MKLPKFKNQAEYDKANLLLQPIYIRVLDNIRKEEESSDWSVKYKEIKEPFPSYIVAVEKDDYRLEQNVWQLCFEICFTNFTDDREEELVQTDQILIDENGEVDWHQLESKTAKYVKNLFIKK